jgi:carbonic anhydrase
LIFDQGLGDVFSVRIAGDIINEDILGSMEFACKIAGSKIIVVLGDTKCGAVKGSCDHVEMGYLTALLSKLQPAVYDEKPKLKTAIRVTMILWKKSRSSMSNGQYMPSLNAARF